MEACLRLRTSILLSSPDKPPQTILVTSSIPGEGKTTIAAQLGIVLAQTGADTILVDLDLRRSELGLRFGLNGQHSGMSVFLSGNSNVLSDLVETEIPNLLIAPAGPRPPNPADLLGSERMRKTLEMLKNQFRFIVIDSPPVMSVTDPAILAPMVDGVVMVVRSGVTPRKIVNQASVSLRRTGSRLLGVVLNAVDYHNPEYHYYGRYYYQEKYYTSDADAVQMKKAKGTRPAEPESGIEKGKGG
jgi:capsular exopolysaccharide synthesis family protein